jgi:hypothetical protein
MSDRSPAFELAPQSNPKAPTAILRFAFPERIILKRHPDVPALDALAQSALQGSATCSNNNCLKPLKGHKARILAQGNIRCQIDAHTTVTRE